MNSKKYNILFLNSIRENVWGGGENLMYNLALRLSSRGHKIWVAGRKNSKFLNHFSNDKINVVPLNIKGDFGPLNILFLSRLLLKEKIDFAWVNFNKDLRLGGIAAHLAGRPKVIWLMGVCLPENSIIHRITGKRLPDKIVVPSQSLKDQLRQFPWIDNNKVMVIPNGSDFDNLNFDSTKAKELLCRRFSIDAKCSIVGVPARLVNAKGHVYLLQAMSEIIRFCTDVKVLFVGDGPNAENLKSISRQLNLDNHVIFTGHIKEIYEVMAGFDLLALPSITESAGLVLVEGMGLGKPVVASAVGGIPGIVEHNITGLLVPPQEPHLLAEAIVKLLNNKEMADQFGAAGRKRALELFNINEMIDKVVALLDEMSEK
jgi:glycosyltransferase involved in cell wall biosynthesis